MQRVEGKCLTLPHLCKTLKEEVALSKPNWVSALPAIIQEASLPVYKQETKAEEKLWFGENT